MSLGITLKYCVFYQYIVAYPATLLLLFFVITVAGDYWFNIFHISKSAPKNPSLLVLFS